MLFRSVQSLTSSIEQIRTTLQDGLASGPAVAQAARQVALALATQTSLLLAGVGEMIQSVSKPEGTADTETDHPSAAFVQVAQEVVQAITDECGVDKEAIPPYLCEVIAIMIPVIEDLVTTANEKIAQANALTK